MQKFIPRPLGRGRKAVLAVSAAVFVWSWMPALVDGSFGVGVVAPALAAAAVAAWVLCVPPYDKVKGWGRGMWMAAVALACTVAVMAGVVSTLMVRAAVSSPREGATVIVLGSKIHGDQPSRMMRQRLDAAADRLEADPTAHCVVTGGLGPGETYTEAYVMEKYLVEVRGVDPARIAREDAATDTHENVHLSMDIIRQRGWSTDVAVATQVFHQYRARRLAFGAGATDVGGAACLSPVHLMFYYWVRECAAICRLWLTGY